MPPATKDKNNSQQAASKMNPQDSYIHNQAPVGVIPPRPQVGKLMGPKPVVSDGRKLDTEEPGYKWSYLCLQSKNINKLSSSS